MIYIFLCLVIFARISNSNKILPTSNLKSPDYFNVSLDQSKSNNVFFADQDEIRFLAIGDWGSGKKGKNVSTIGGNSLCSIHFSILFLPI